MKHYSIIKLIIIGICLLCLVTGTIASTCKTKGARTCTSDKETHTTDNPPDWAMGYFNGTFGILLHGNPSSELGKCEGYWESNVIGYSHFEKGRIQAEIFENESLIPNWNISAKMFAKDTPTYVTSIVYGRLSNIQKEKTYFLVGIGKLSKDGTLEFKMLTILSDNYYLKGNWGPFEE